MITIMLHFLLLLVILAIPPLPVSKELSNDCRVLVPSAVMPRDSYDQMIS